MGKDLCPHIKLTSGVYSFNTLQSIPYVLSAPVWVVEFLALLFPLQLVFLFFFVQPYPVPWLMISWTNQKKPHFSQFLNSSALVNMCFILFMLLNKNIG